MISTARTCNLIIIVLDCLKPLTHKRLIEHELEGFGIRLNKKPPGISFRKKDKGGINFVTTVSSPKLDLESGSCLLLLRCNTLHCCTAVPASRTPVSRHRSKSREKFESKNHFKLFIIYFNPLFSNRVQR